MPTNKARIGALVEKYLQICKDSNNKNGEGIGFLKLGQILSEQVNLNDLLDRRKNSKRVLKNTRKPTKSDLRLRIM
jgi:hypothetical protein